MARHPQWQRNISAILATSILAGALSGCTISDDPLTTAAATAATIGVASLLFFNTSDNHYYDRNYNRLPRDYRRYRNDYDRRDDRDWREDNRREYHDRWNRDHYRHDNPQRMMW